MKLSNSLISILHRSTSSKNNEIFFKSIRSSNLGKSSLVMLNPKIFELLSAFNPIFIAFENKFNLLVIFFPRFSPNLFLKKFSNRVKYILLVSSLRSFISYSDR